MHPILFKFGPVTIYSYGVMVAIGFFLAVYLACRQAPKFNIPKEFIFDLGFWVIIAGIVGARLFYIIENIKFYINDPKEIFLLNHGGLSFFGGLFLSLLVAVIITKKRRLSLLEVFDLCIPFVALAQSVGRIGCFFNGCCHGKESLQFGMYFPAIEKIVIPTQIYSSLYLLVLFVFLRILQEINLKAEAYKPGLVFLNYLIFYSAGRFIIEFFRGDNPVVFAGLTLFQIIAGLVFLGAIFYARDQFKS